MDSKESQKCCFCTIQILSGKSYWYKDMETSALNSHVKDTRHCELIKMHEQSGGGILTHFAAKPYILQRDYGLEDKTNSCYT